MQLSPSLLSLFSIDFIDVKGKGEIKAEQTVHIKGICTYS